jgi:peptidoglycan/LPS O-acetylase OafA/YrhL
LIFRPTIHITPASRHRFHLLDALRGIAAVLVMIGHSKYLAHRLGLHNGFLAVDFFFCLSGFVIASSYENRLRSGLRACDFLAARIIRLYPVYFLAISLALIYELSLTHVPRTFALPAFVMAVFLVPNLHLIRSVFLFPLDQPSWSLLLEILANIAYVLLIKFISGSTWLFSLIASLAFVVLAYGILHGRMLGLTGVVNGNHQPALGIARVLASFLLGVLTLRLYRARAHFQLSPRLRSLAPVVIILALVFILESPFAVMQTNTFYLLSIALLFPALTCIGASANPPAAWTAICVALGELSYPLYLLHLPLLEFANSRLFLHLSSAMHSVLAIIAMVVAIAAAYWVAQKFDTPVRRILSNFYRNAPWRTAQPTASLP